MKNKRGFGKTCHFFPLKLLILDDWAMPNGFMTNWVTPWSLWPSKKWSVEILGRYNGFLSLKVNILSIQSVFFLGMLYCYSTNKFHEPFLWNTPLKLLPKGTTQIKLFNIPLAVCKIILNIYEIPCIHLWQVLWFSQCVSKFVRTCNSM